VLGDPQEGGHLVAQVELLNDSLLPLRFLWSRSSPSSLEDFMPIFDHSHGHIYPLNQYFSALYLHFSREDVGCKVKCTVCVLDPVPLHSQRTASIAATKTWISPTVEPGLPRIESLRILGGPDFTRPFTLVPQYFGGKEGASRVEWFRVFPDGKVEAIALAAEKRTYEPSPSDVDCRLEVRVTPSRIDGVCGAPCTVISKPILKVLGSLRIYTVAGMPGCLQAKALLQQWGVPFVEVDLLKHPAAQQTMEQLSKSCMVPQFYINRHYLGVCSFFRPLK
jgi:glutaredoxin